MQDSANWEVSLDTKQKKGVRFTVGCKKKTTNTHRDEANDIQGNWCKTRQTPVFQYAQATVSGNNASVLPILKVTAYTWNYLARKWISSQSRRTDQKNFGPNISLPGPVHDKFWQWRNNGDIYQNDMTKAAETVPQEMRTAYKSGAQS